jgi:hypothetical protein
MYPMTDRVPKCNAIHKTIVEQFRQAIVYGKSVKHQPQRVGLSHELADEDISKSLVCGVDFSLTFSVTIIKR